MQDLCPNTDHPFTPFHQILAAGGKTWLNTLDTLDTLVTMDTVDTLDPLDTLDTRNILEIWKTLNKCIQLY